MLFDAASTTAWRLLLGLARWAALRRGEALNLRWHNIDWTRNRLQVISREDWDVKDKQPRVIPICPELSALILCAFEQAPEGGPNVIPEGSINVNNVWRDFVVLCKRADIVRFSGQSSERYIWRYVQPSQAQKEAALDALF